MNTYQAFTIGIIGLAVGVFLFSINMGSSIAASPSSSPSPLVCSGKLWTASWCGPCQQVKKNLNIKTDADWSAAFGIRLAVNDVDVVPLPPPQTTVPYLQTFNQDGKYIGSVSSAADITKQLQSLKANIAAKKCPAVVTPSPKPSPSSTPQPTPTITPKTVPTTQPTISPRTSVQPLSQQLGARAFSSPITDTIGAVIGGFFSWIGSGIVFVIKLVMGK